MTYGARPNGTRRRNALLPGLCAETLIVCDVASPSPLAPTFSGTPGLAVTVTVRRHGGLLVAERRRVSFNHTGAAPVERIEAFTAEGLLDLLGDDRQARRVVAAVRARLAAG